MRNYITLNGKNSNEINGLLIQELPPISKPQIRTEVEEIDGRDGDIVTKLGFAAYDKEFTVGLYKDFDINAIIAYFNSEGTVVFSNEPDKYYNYQIIDQIDFERLVRYRTATVRMHCQPFKYSTTQGTITKDASATVSDEGSDIALDGTAEAPFNVLRHKGNATQTTYTGKNLFNLNATPVASGNATLTASGQTFTVTSNSTNATARVEMPLAYEANRQMTVSFDVKTLVYEPAESSGPAVYLREHGASSSDMVIISSLSRVVGWTKHIVAKITPDSNTRVLWFYLKSIARAGVVSYEFSNFQIEYGASETSYEQYVGGTPSPNPDYPQDIQVVTGDSTVKITGKNLFNINATIAESHTISSVSGQSVTVTTDNTSSPARATMPFDYLPNKAMTVSFDATCLIYEPTATNSPIVTLRTVGQSDSLAIANLDKTVGKTTHYSVTVTPNNATRVLWLYVRPSAVAGDVSYRFDNIQIEYGSSPSDYESYKEQSYVIPFGDTYLAAIDDYADEPVKVGDTWYIRRKIGRVVLDGSEQWGNANSYAYFYSDIDNFARVVSSEIVGAILSNNYLAKTRGDLWNRRVDYGVCCYEAVSRIGIRNKDCANTDAFKTWLSTHNTTVYYALATPTDEEITDQDLIDALDELYEQAHAYKSHTHITATAQDDNAPAVLSVEVGEDNESTVTNSGNINSKPVIKIYGSGNIGAYLNDIQILQIALGDEEYITIDTNLMEAYKDTLDNLKNRLVTGDYSKFSLKPGANKIHFSGTVTKYEISKYSRWL